MGLHLTFLSLCLVRGTNISTGYHSDSAVLGDHGPALDHGGHGGHGGDDLMQNLVGHDDHEKPTNDSLHDHEVGLGWSKYHKYR